MFLMSVSAYLLVTFWLFWPYTPIVINSIVIMNKDDIYAGGVLRYETDYTKTHSYPVVSVVRQLIDGAVIVLAPGKASKLPKSQSKVAVEVPIPGFACVGKYRFRLEATYQVNPIRTVSVVALSDEFEIKRHDTGQLELLINQQSEQQANRIKAVEGIQDGRVVDERVPRDQYETTDRAGSR